MHHRNLRYIVMLMIVFMPLTWSVWYTHNGRPALDFVAAVTETSTPTAASTTVPPSPTQLLPSTPTAVPTTSPSPTTPPLKTPASPIMPTRTAVPSPTPTLTSTPTIPSTPAVGGSCPPFPAKPDYSRYVVGSNWPAPNLDLAADHFWLAKPLPGGGRFLTNLNYPYGYDGGGRYLLHNGIDSAETLGTPVLAAADGTVVVAQMDINEVFGWRCDWYHHLVVIELDQQWLGRPLFVLYGHVQNITVEPGQHVSRGEQVAEVGVGGAAIVPHLHVEVRWGENIFGSTVNPYLWISPGSTRGVVAGRLVTPDGRPWQGVGLSIAGISEDTNELVNTWTYLADPAGRVTVQPDAGWAENFVFADLKPGAYVIYTKVRDVDFQASVTVTAGQVIFVELVAADEG